MNGNPFDFEEKEIIRTLSDTGERVCVIHASVNEFRRQNNLTPRHYKVIADRVNRLRSESDTGNIYASILGYGPRVSTKLQDDAIRRRIGKRSVTARLMNDPLFEDSALAKPSPKPVHVRACPLDFSDLEPEARFLARLQYEMHAPESLV